MKNNSWLARMLVSGCFCLAMTIALIGHNEIACGQDEIPPMPPAHAFRQAVIAEHRVPDSDPQQSWAISRATHALLSELGPGVMIRVTKSFPGGLLESECAAPTACEAMLQHYGAGLGTCHLDCDELGTQFVGLDCPCTAAGTCQCAAEAACGTDCAAACKCCPCATETKCADKQHASEHCTTTVGHTELLSPPHAGSASQDQLELLQHMATLLADAAAARAELETRKAASEKLVELYETIAELIAANAALEAKLEAQTEHAKLAEKLAELATENARLKTHVEFAAGRVETSQQAISLTLENERLKLRLADLEQKHALSEAVRTSARPRGERKAR